MKHFLSLLFLFAAVSVFADGVPSLTPAEQKLLKGIGATVDEKGDIHLDSAVIDRKTKEIRFPAEVNIREGIIEVLISTRKGRTHESLFISDLDPFRLQLALILAGYRIGPMLAGLPLPQGSKFDVIVETDDGKTRKADDWLFDSSAKEVKADDGYVFVGSNFTNRQCLASVEGNSANINSGDRNTILNAVLNANNVNHEYVARTKEIPEVGRGKVILRLAPFQASARTKNTTPVAVYPDTSASEALAKFAEVEFTTENILYDFQRLEPVIAWPVPADSRESARKIVELKIRKTDAFLKAHENDKGNELYKKAEKIRVRLDRVLELYR